MYILKIVWFIFSNRADRDVMWIDKVHRFAKTLIENGEKCISIRFYFKSECEVGTNWIKFEKTLPQSWKHKLRNFSSWASSSPLIPGEKSRWSMHSSRSRGKFILITCTCEKSEQVGSHHAVAYCGYFETFRLICTRLFKSNPFRLSFLQENCVQELILHFARLLG